MKRKRDDSMASARANQNGKRVKGECDEPAESQELGPFANLPSTIITNHIMIPLPIKSLAICKLVCKTWNALISDPYFSKLHLQHAQPRVMIRTNDDNRVSRTLHLLELGMFGSILNNHVKLEPSFKLPLPYDRLTFKNRRLLRDRHTCYGRNKRLYGKFGVVNSCNGLLCLNNEFDMDLVVCNPITGEFITLPKSIEDGEFLRYVSVGFGFHSKNDEYKVVRIKEKFDRRERSLVVQIYTLGKPTWRNFDVDNEFLTKIKCLAFPTCVNDALHWINFDGWQRSILCFDFESEKFQSFPSPPHVLKDDSVFDIGLISLAEIGGILYLCDASSRNSCIMWVMKNYGVGGSWTTVFQIGDLHIPEFPYGPDGLCWPVKHVENGAAILMQPSPNCLEYYEPEKNGYKFLRVIGSQAESFEVIPHIPSLVSLKDVVNGDKIEVLNVHSRWCGKFKLKEEKEVLFLTGEVESPSDSEDDSEEYSDWSS